MSDFRKLNVTWPDKLHQQRWNELMRRIDEALDAEESDDLTMVKVPVSSAAGTYTASIDGLVPAGSLVTRISLVVATPYNNAATIACTLFGGGAPPTLMATTDNNPLVANTYELPVWREIQANEAGRVRVTVGGTPNQGASTLYLEFIPVPRT